MKILKEYAPDRIDEISKYSTRWLEVNEKYLQLVEQRSGAFHAEHADDSDSDLPEQPSSDAYYGGSSTSVPKHPPYAYEGSSSGVPRYPPQKRRRHPELDEPLHPELAAAL